MKIITYGLALFGGFVAVLWIAGTFGIGNFRLYCGPEHGSNNDVVIVSTKRIIKGLPLQGEVDIQRTNNGDFKCILKQAQGKEAYGFDDSPSGACLNLIAFAQSSINFPNTK
jgi:hypothetical protein